MELSFKEIVSLHKLLKTIILDRDMRLLSKIRRTLWKRLGTRLQCSYTYHPKTNGQT
jgi:hypothetical protein